MNSKKINDDLAIAREISDRYEEAIQLSPTQKKVFLEVLQAQSPYVASQVHALLYHGDTVGVFLENSPAERERGLLENEPTKLNLPVGERVHHFLIEGVLGAGSFAVVYLATDLSLGRKVALKVTDNESSEAQTLAHLEHDSIVTIYSEEIDEETSRRFIAMQYIPGSTLEEVLKELRDPSWFPLTGESILESLNCKNVTDTSILRNNFVIEWERLKNADYTEAILVLVMKICDAIQYAHKQGILHLDIKPSNIILSHYGRPFLTDFNVSIDQTGKFSIENLGGTPRYMAPEQAKLFEVKNPLECVGALTPGTDIYSLSMVAKECLEVASVSGPPIDKYLLWILNRGSELDPQIRIKNAFQFKEIIQGFLDLREIKEAMEVEKQESALAKHPLILLTLIGAVPQVVSTFIGSNYNILRILPELSEAQRESFQWLNLVVTPGLFLLLGVFWVSVVVRLNPYLKNPLRFASHPRKVEALRRHLLNIPKWGMLCTTLGWLPVSVIIPLVLHFKYGGLSGFVMGHFAISFFLSWLIALSYSFLFHSYIVIAYGYAQFWMGCTEVRTKAISELRRILRSVKLALVSVILIPLGGSLLILSTGELSNQGAGGITISQLVSALILFSMVGVFISFALGARLNRIFLAVIRK